MALIKCVECGNKISDKAAACIFCGCPMTYILEQLERESGAKESEVVKDEIIKNEYGDFRLQDEITPEPDVTDEEKLVGSYNVLNADFLTDTVEPTVINVIPYQEGTVINHESMLSEIPAAEIEESADIAEETHELKLEDTDQAEESEQAEELNVDTEEKDKAEETEEINLIEESAQEVKQDEDTDLAVELTAEPEQAEESADIAEETHELKLEDSDQAEELNADTEEKEDTDQTEEADLAVELTAEPEQAEESADNADTAQYSQECGANEENTEISDIIPDEGEDKPAGGFFYADEGEDKPIDRKNTDISDEFDFDFLETAVEVLQQEEESEEEDADDYPVINDSFTQERNALDKALEEAIKRMAVRSERRTSIAAEEDEALNTADTATLDDVDIDNATDTVTANNADTDVKDGANSHVANAIVEDADVIDTVDTESNVNTDTANNADANTVDSNTADTNNADINIAETSIGNDNSTEEQSITSELPPQSEADEDETAEVSDENPFFDPDIRDIEDVSGEGARFVLEKNEDGYYYNYYSARKRLLFSGDLFDTEEEARADIESFIDAVLNGNAEILEETDGDFHGFYFCINNEFVGQYQSTFRAAGDVLAIISKTIKKAAVPPQKIVAPKLSDQELESLFTFERQDDGYGITAFHGELEKVFIPSAYRGEKVVRLLSLNCDAENGAHVTALYVPSSVKEIAEGAVRNMLNLLEVYIPASVEVIGDGAFADCNAAVIKAVVAKKPDGWAEFWNANELDDYVRPVIWDCKNNEIADNGLSYITGKKGDRWALNADLKTATLIRFTGEGSYAMPSSLNVGEESYAVTAIGAEAFMGGGVTEILMPKSVEELGEGAFFGCSALTKAVLSPSLKTLPKRVFYGCTALPRLSLPKELEKIGSEALARCSSLKFLDVPPAVTVDGNAFEGCNGLLMVYFPASVDTQGVNPFGSCGGFTVYTDGTLPVCFDSFTVNVSDNRQNWLKAVKPLR